MNPSAPALRQVGLLPRHVELVESSYARVASRGRAMAIAFYEELFETMPTLRALFPRDDAEQRKIATSFVGFVVTNLAAPHRLIPLLERMGHRGILHDLTQDELAGIGQTFSMVLRDFDGPRWTVETSHAWALCIGWTIAAMQHGAEHARFGNTG